MDIKENTREVASCTHTILDDEVLMVPDATKNARFCQIPRYCLEYPCDSPTEKHSVCCLMEIHRMSPILQLPVRFADFIDDSHWGNRLRYG